MSGTVLRILSLAVASSLATAGCGPGLLEFSDEQDLADGVTEDALAVSANEHWFYGGPLPMLESPHVTVALDGHTARVSGLLPAGFVLAELPPHVRLTPEAGRTRLDAVYPIATARPGKSNPSVGNYRFYDVIPYRPDGTAVTAAEGSHFVPWGGFPFLRYNAGIALHGPITFADNKTAPDVDVWYLQRGRVSGGCNRMMGEHVVELAHLSGVDMRRVYPRNGTVNPVGAATVRVLRGYDQFQGKYIDTDFPTDGNLTTSTMTRAGKMYGAQNVEMFGSWVASRMPDGRDLPRDLKWQGGVSGAWYVFSEHQRSNWVCSVPSTQLTLVKAYLARVKALPAGFCEKQVCTIQALKLGGDPAIDCALQ